MGINLLPQVEENVQSSVKKEVTVFVIAGIWFGLIVLVTSGLYLYKALEVRRLEEVRAEKTKLLEDLKNIAPVVDNYYNIAYKSVVLTYVSSKKYRPSVIKDYIDSKVAGRGTVESYYINGQGEVKISITAPDYSNAVHIWHSLLTNKDIIEELNLNTFSADKDEKVQFVLKGKLNLPELYKAYENQKK